LKNLNKIKLTTVKISIYSSYFYLHFLTPLTSAEVLSQSYEISEIAPLPASTVVGPP
jgi:hypothetical protein